MPYKETKVQRKEHKYAEGTEMGIVIPRWVGYYLNIPYESGGRTRAGIDTWGLIRLVWAEQLGCALPSYLRGGTTDIDIIGDSIQGVNGHDGSYFEEVEDCGVS